MDNLLHERIAKRTRAEVRYLRGYQCMNMERFREYQNEFRVACEQADYRKVGELVQDTIQISTDTMRIIGKRRAITARHSFIRAQDTSRDSDELRTIPPLAIQRTR
jgi:hypothetical protein